MPFPKIIHPTATTKLPSTGAAVRFRPMQAREEKVLLMAKESGEEADVLTAVRDVLRNCVSGVDVDDLPIFDVEWLFIRLRMVSVDPVAEVSYIDRSDGKQYDFKVELDKVEVERAEGADPAVRVTEDVAIQLRWPSVDDFTAAAASENPTQELVYRAIDKVYDGDNLVDARKEPRADLVEFADSLDLESYHKIVAFIEATPKLRYVIDYKNSKGEDRKIVLSRLQDFFSF